MCPAFLISMQIPVQLRLADSEVSSLEQPPVLYVSVEFTCGSLRRRCWWHEKGTPVAPTLTALLVSTGLVSFPLPNCCSS